MNAIVNLLYYEYFCHMLHSVMLRKFPIVPKICREQMKYQNMKVSFIKKKKKNMKVSPIWNHWYFPVLI